MQQKALAELSGGRGGSDLAEGDRGHRGSHAGKQVAFHVKPVRSADERCATGQTARYWWLPQGRSGG